MHRRSPVGTGRSSPFLDKGVDNLGVDVLLLQDGLVLQSHVAVDMRVILAQGPC